jgi:hypothetical protein
MNPMGIKIPDELGNIFPSFLEGVMKKYLPVILLIFLSPFFIGGQSLPVESERSISLIFSSNVYGEIEPCG